MRIAKVTWLDAWFDREQIHPDEVRRKPFIVYTIGCVIEDNEEVIIVAHEVFEDGTLRGYTCIPKLMVVAIEG